MNDFSADTSEHAAITATIQIYVDGAISGSTEQLKPAFHPDAVIHGYVGPDLFAGPIQLFFDWHDENGPAEGLQSRIASIDVQGTIATVRQELDNWTGHKFTDMFTLLKEDGTWKITAKVFYLHP